MTTARTNMSAIPLLIFACAVVLHSCKEDSNPVQPPNRLEILTGTTWSLQKAVSSGGSDITDDFPVKRVTFKKDGTFDMGWATGTWSFLDNESKISLADPTSGMSGTGEILRLDETSFSLSFPLLGAATADFIPAPPPLMSPITNFDSLWNSFDRLYSFFVVKNVNWDSLRNVYRPMITDNTSEADLFAIFSSMLSHLKDGHVRLSSPSSFYVYTDWYVGRPENFPGHAVLETYLSRNYGMTADGMIRFGRIADTVGYLYVGPYLTGTSSDWTKAIDAVMDSLKDVSRFIVDIRNNGGGNEGLAAIVASRFADQSRIYTYVQFRKGPNHGDFTPLSPNSISPNGPRRFTGRVAFLTNRRCFSSAEGFTLMMRVMPHITVVGDTTGGGSANPAIVELPNGWQVWVSRWIQHTVQQTVFEGIGLPPDVPIDISPADSAAGHDTILEHALQEIR